MIVIALGANLPSLEFGAPRHTLEAALQALEAEGIQVVEQSRWYASAAVPVSDQPDYVNGVVEVTTAKTPEALLAALHQIERQFGRRRNVRNEARILDLDLIDYNGQVLDRRSHPILPHPRMHTRAFVLLPLAEIAPDWRHPVLHQSIGDMIDQLGDVEETEVLP